MSHIKDIFVQDFPPNPNHQNSDIPRIMKPYNKKIEKVLILTKKKNMKNRKRVYLHTTKLPKQINTLPNTPICHQSRNMLLIKRAQHQKKISMGTSQCQPPQRNRYAFIKGLWFTLTKGLIRGLFLGGRVALGESSPSHPNSPSPRRPRRSAVVLPRSVSPAPPSEAWNRGLRGS